MLTQAARAASVSPQLQTNQCTVHCTVAAMCLPILTRGQHEVVRGKSLAWPDVHARLRHHSMMHAAPRAGACVNVHCKLCCGNACRTARHEAVPAMQVFQAPLGALLLTGAARAAAADDSQTFRGPGLLPPGDGQWLSTQSAQVGAYL